MVRGIVLILAVFGTVVLHELGHALAARRFGVRTLDITLLPIGGVARLERFPDKPREQLVVALAGPAVNVAIALVLLGLLSVLHGPLDLDAGNLSGAPFLAQLMWINVALAAFNLLPGFPMDGGRVLRAILAMRLPPERATQTAAQVGQVVAVIFGFVGLLVNPFLVVIAAFVWFGARSERSHSMMKVALEGLSVHDGMITRFETLSPTDALQHVVEIALAGFQRDFPVTEGGRLVGAVAFADVLRGLGDSGPPLTVGQVMRSQPPTVTSSAPLAGALSQLQQPESQVLIVLDEGRVVGLLAAESLQQLVAVPATSRRRRARLSPEAQLAASTSSW